MHSIRFRDPAGSVREGRLVEGRVVAGDRRYDFEEVDVLAPCEPTKIVCVGLNYADHAAERDKRVPGRNVAREEALSYVAGYTCLNDISNRDDQDREVQWVRGKAFDNAAPMGPVLATPEEVPDDARIELRVDGETKQSSSIDQFFFSVPELITEISQYLTLEAGDVISTGTPAGVGPLSDGDHVEVEIEGIGTLAHDVVIPDDG